MTQFMEFLVELTGPWTLDLLWQACTNFWGPPVIEMVGPWVELVGPWVP